MLGQCCPQVQIKPWTEQECVIDAGGPQVYTSVFDDGTKRCRKKQKENLDAVDEASDGEPSLGTRPSQSSLFTIAQDCFLLSIFLPLHTTNQALQKVSQIAVDKYLPSSKEERKSKH